MSRTGIKLMEQPSAGWSMRRNLWVHGLARPSDYVRMAPAYSMNGREHMITCPTLLCTIEGDNIGAQMRDLATRIGALADFRLFRAADDVSQHCEQSNRGALHREAFGWLDRVLRKRAGSPPSQLARTVKGTVITRPSARRNWPHSW